MEVLIGSGLVFLCLIGIAKILEARALVRSARHECFAWRSDEFIEPPNPPQISPSTPIPPRPVPSLPSPPAAGQASQPFALHRLYKTGDQFISCQMKNGEQFIWFYNEQTMPLAMKHLGQCAADPRHPMDWSNVAYMTQLMRQAQWQIDANREAEAEAEEREREHDRERDREHGAG